MSWFFINSKHARIHSVYVYGDEAALLWTTGQVYGLVVKGGPVVDLMRVLFEMTWKRASTTRKKLDKKKVAWLNNRGTTYSLLRRF